MTKNNRQRNAPASGSLFKAKDGGWTAMISASDATGRRIRRRATRPSKKAAQAWLDEQREARKAGLRAEDSTLTLGAWLDRWLKLKVVEVRPATFSNYEGIVRDHVPLALKRKLLAKVTPLDIDDLLADRRSEGYSPRTLHHIRGVLARAFLAAVQKRLLVFSPVAAAQRVKLPASTATAFTKDEARRFLAAAHGSKHHALFASALITGCRQSELFGLRWTSLDLDAGTLRVECVIDRVKVGEGQTAWRFFPPKTAKSARIITLPPTLIEILRAHRTAQLETRLRAGPHWQGERWGGLVFTGDAGGPLDNSTIRYHLKRLIEQAGLPPLGFHALRHTNASLAFAEGVEPLLVSRNLGHSSLAITEQVYIHALQSTRPDAASAVADALFLEPGVADAL